MLIKLNNTPTFQLWAILFTDHPQPIIYTCHLGRESEREREKQGTIIPLYMRV